MRIPIIKPTKFTHEIDEDLKRLSTEANSENTKKYHERLHKENIFNKRFSGVLDTFSDLKSVVERMEENIEHSIRVESQIQNKKEIDQELFKRASRLTSQNKADLRTLYVNSKIFLDEYTSLLRFIFNWRDIGDKSVTSFFNSLDKYNGADKDVLLFKEICFKKLKAVNVYITEYRDDKVVHNQKKHKQETEWFLNNMNGEIRLMGGGRSSLTPQEILFVVLGYVNLSTSFCTEWIKEKKSH